MKMFLSVLAVATMCNFAPPARADAGTELRALLQSADADDLDLHPQNRLLRGDLTHAGEFGDLISDAYFARAEAGLRRQLAALAKVERDKLGSKDRIAYDAFRYSAGFALRQHREGIHRIGRQWPIDHVFGQHLVFQQLSAGGAAAPYKTTADYEAGLQRFGGFVTYLDRAILRLQEGLREGRAHPKVITRKVIAQLDAELALAADQSPFFQPAATPPADFTAEARQRFESAYRKAIHTQLRPALKRLRDYLAGAYLKAGRTEKPGLAGVKDGAKYYASQLEAHTTTQLPAERIYALGLAEVARIEAEMDAVRRQVGFEGDRRAFIEHLKSDPRYRHASAGALLDSYREVQRKVEAALPRLFLNLPRGRCEVRAVPPEQESSAGGAYYLIGTPDGERPGVFFVNTSNLPTRTTPRTIALYLHEAMPGHHLQGSLAQEDELLPPNLRFNWNPGFGEGWALYAEWLGREMGLYEDPIQYFGRLDMEIIRAVRLVVDTGLHAKGWSRDEAIATMLRHTTLDRDAVEQEVDRYIVWPGQATAYKVGELFIRDLRRRAEAALGARFDVRRFHDAVLNTGALPLFVLGQKIDEWIESESKTPMPAAKAGSTRARPANPRRVS